MTYMQAALTVLSYADRPLTVPEITAVAVAEGLVRPRGRTPDRTMSSVLYRRMATDPDAPVISRGGRLWLRARPLPADQASYLARRARRARRAAGSAGRDRRDHGGARLTDVRPPTVLPAPPLRLPLPTDDGVAISVRPAPSVAAGSARLAPTYRPVRRDRAVVRAGERAAGLLERLERRRALAAGLKAAETERLLVAPLLRHLGYGVAVDIAPAERAGRGTVARLLSAGGAPVIALHVRHAAHDLGDDDAWRALGTARQAAAPYAAATNGRQLRLYAAALAEAHDDVAAALVLALDLTPTTADGEARQAQAAALWLLSRDAVADGALDAYVADRAVGGALLEALDAADSPLALALIADVRARTGLDLPTALVLRHARMVVRGRRGRDGEPLSEDVATVAAVRGPSFDITAVAVASARSA